MNIACIPACAAFTLFYLTTLYVMRGNLGAGIMLLGLTYIFWPRRHLRIIDLVLGLVLIGCSYYFHKSMLLSLALLVPAFFRLSKKTITISFCLFPVAVGIMKVVLAQIGSNGIDGVDETISNSALRYSNVEAFTFNAFGIFRNIVVYLAPYLILIYAYHTNLMDKLPYRIRFFFNYWYIWVYIASVCAFQDVGGWYYSRFMYMSNLPLMVFMGYVFQNFQKTKILKTIILASAAGSLYVLAYAFYVYELK